jgi:hypothetical protein
MSREENSNYNRITKIKHILAKEDSIKLYKWSHEMLGDRMEVTWAASREGENEP